MEFREQVRRVVGCEQCGGTGWLQRGNRPYASPGAPVALEDTTDCPAEHVEVTLYDGTVIWADPSKCTWFCVAELDPFDLMTTAFCRPNYDGEGHEDCGYQPLWSALNQEQNDE